MIVLCLAVLGGGCKRTASHPPIESLAAEELIPRRVLFGTPERMAAEISPDGDHLAFLAPKGEVMGLWVAPVVASGVDFPSARPVGPSGERSGLAYRWTYDSEHIVYIEDHDGDEQYHVYAVDLASGETRDLTPFEGARASVVAVEPSRPDTIVVAVNDRDPVFDDLYEVEVATGNRHKIFENPGFARTVVDRELQPRLGYVSLPDGSIELRVPRRRGEEAWVRLTTIPFEDAETTRFETFDARGQVVYGSDSRGRDTAAWVALDLETGATEVLAEDPSSDIERALLHPGDHSVQAVRSGRERERWTVLDQRIEEDFAKLAEVQRGDFAVVARTLDDRIWTVEFTADDAPLRTYLWDRDERRAVFVFSESSELEVHALARMHPEVITARDGLELVSYLTLPRASDPDGDGRPQAPVPMVLEVHGGPQLRDRWGLSTSHQFLANRGYAVLSVNFRGSTGFGKAFVNAGNRQWGKAMHDDLLDAVAWAIDQKITSPDTICIAGTSYGGYAVLVGLAMTPEVFACGAAYAPPSNLVTLLSSIPTFFVPFAANIKARVGDWTTAEGRAALTAVSPLTHADRIQRPLLIAQGSNDARVPPQESERIVEAMQRAGVPVTYVVFPNEGHAFRRHENLVAHEAIYEAFLAAHLGGRVEPLTAEELAGADFRIEAGRENIPGLPTGIDAEAAPSEPSVSSDR